MCPIIDLIFPFFLGDFQRFCRISAELLSFHQREMNFGQSKKPALPPWEISSKFLLPILSKYFSALHTDYRYQTMCICQIVCFRLEYQVTQHNAVPHEYLDIYFHSFHLPSFIPEKINISTCTAYAHNIF